MDRGDVHLIELDMPNRATGVGTVKRNKYVVILRGGPAAAAETDVPFVIASSDDRPPGTPLRRFEVLVGPAVGFHHDTVIDCRWVYTQTKARFPANSKRFTLPPHVMLRVSVALVVGLQMKV